VLESGGSVASGSLVNPPQIISAGTDDAQMRLHVQAEEEEEEEEEQRGRGCLNLTLLACIQLQPDNP
jgi:hypothetical protein